MDPKTGGVSKDEFVVDLDRLYHNYLETRRMSGVTPVPRERRTLSSPNGRKCGPVDPEPTQQ